MLANVRRWLPIALVAVTALWLRTHDLDVRPMHADEANQAVKVGALLERGHYEFDPADHHGPTLCVDVALAGRMICCLTAPPGPGWAMGWAGWATLTHA